MSTNSSNSSRSSNRSSRESVARGTLTRLRAGAIQEALGEMLFVVCVAFMLSGCAAVSNDPKIPTAENQETAVTTCSYLRTEQASCDDLTKAYNQGFRAGKEIVAAEFRTRTELNQPYVWKPPLVSEVDMPARVVNGVMIPAHRELVIVKPGYWVRTESVITDSR